MARTLTSTTLAAAVTASDKEFNIASATGVEVNDLFIVDDEAMSVLAINGVFVRVQRGVAGTRASSHASGKKVWHGQPGDFYGSRKSGTGDSSVEVVLPRVVLGKDGVIVQNIVDSKWVTIEDDAPKATKQPVYSYTAAGAITIAAGDHFVNGTTLAMTLADPAATDDGLELSVIAENASAHTLSNAAGSGFNAGGAGTDVGTFGGAIGDNITVVARGGKWLVKSKVNVTLG